MRAVPLSLKISPLKRNIPRRNPQRNAPTKYPIIFICHLIKDAMESPETICGVRPRKAAVPNLMTTNSSESGSL
jgi:hypothetical protein